ncbi:hypothetical protein COU59_03575 [Candidatus Pacearchaeota archaeon CG10_big_fil_rev_8_21_14_0_10_34_12]|nr:MAG: hypothetical protein COU59_03575 [Candidatus Pacearchaeota archaeon CG10_big_fil_rev_8_21_14_0_10_34_12]
MKNIQKTVSILIGIVFIGLMTYGFSFFNNSPTGQVILGLDSNYNEGEALSGTLDISLQPGEFIPASMKIVIENGNDSLEYLLSDVISEPVSEGEFYIEGTEVSGSGMGFGQEGEKLIYPDVYFTLMISQSKEVPLETTETTVQSETQTPASDGVNSETEDSTTETNSNETQTSQEVSENLTQQETQTEPAQENPSQTEEQASTSAETTSEESQTEPITETQSDETQTTTEDVKAEIPAATTGETVEDTTSAGETSSATETITSTESSTETTASETSSPETSVSESVSSEAVSPPITGGVIAGIFKGISNFFLSLTPTGRVTLEINQGNNVQIEGQTSKGSDFSYDLGENQVAKIVSGSVKTNSENLSDSEINLKIQNGQAVVTTDYSISEKGFGEGYSSGESRKISINLSNVNFIPQQGNLKIILSNEGKEIVSLNTKISTAGSVIAENKTEAEKVSLENKTNLNETKINVTITSSGALTDDERKVLLDEFGNSSVEITKAEQTEKSYVVRFELADFWAERSYSLELSDKELSIQVESDRIAFLKDLAGELANKNEETKPIEGLVGQSYAVR